MKNKPRKGADYAVLGHGKYRWCRRTSSAWSSTDVPHKRYNWRESSLDRMQLLINENPPELFFVRLGTRIPTQNAVVLAEGNKCDLWDLYLAHAHMMAIKNV